jgi:hypothetical protein
MKGYTEGDLEAIPVQMFMVVLIEEDGSGD